MSTTLFGGMGVHTLWKLLKELKCCKRSPMDWPSMNGVAQSVDQHHLLITLSERLSCPTARVPPCQIGQIFAVDLSYWIVESSTAMQHVSHDPAFRPALRNMFFRIKHCLSLGILLVFVLVRLTFCHFYFRCGKSAICLNIPPTLC